MKPIMPRLMGMFENHDKENYYAPRHARVQSSLGLREKSSNSFHSINPHQKPMFKIDEDVKPRQPFQRIKTDANVPQPLRNGRNLSITSGVLTQVRQQQFLFPHHNPQLVQPYRQEILQYLQDNIKSSNGDAFQFQKEITEKMRGILLDWLVDVHHKFKLDQETLFITISIIDRILLLCQIPKSKFQLFGVTALFIAAKYEEVYSVPHVRDLVYVCDNAYSKEEILECEGKIIQLLNFEILKTSAWRMLNHYQEKTKLDTKNFMLCRYLIELAQLEYFIQQQYDQNVIACASIYLVHKIRRVHPSWNPDIMVPLTGLLEAEIRNCAKDLCTLLQNQEKRQFQASRKKYSLPKYMEVSRIKIEKKPNNQ